MRDLEQSKVNERRNMSPSKVVVFGQSLPEKEFLIRKLEAEN